MADNFLTFFDITKQTGTDMAVGIVEEVRTSAPEFSVLSGRPIKGTSYTSLVRSALPTGPGFRAANAGSDLNASKWDNRLNQCFFMDGPMQVDEMVALGSEFGVDYTLANEAIGVFKQKAINLGAQVYYGVAKDKNGFPGLGSLYDYASMEVTANAKGSLGATTSSAWLVVNAIDCVEFIFGKNKGLDVGQWNRQMVQDSNSKKFFAFVNNLCGWAGLSFNFTKSACRIKNLTATSGLSDSLVADALALFPVGVVPTHLFCSRAQRRQLQKSRSAVSTALTGSAPLVYAPTPTESNGIPLFVTDSISDTETATAANALT